MITDVAVSTPGLRDDGNGSALVVGQDIQRWRIHIVELPLANRPYEGADRNRQQHQTQRNKHEQDDQGALSSPGCRISRKAFAVTVNEDNAMPSAASAGVT